MNDKYNMILHVKCNHCKKISKFEVKNNDSPFDKLNEFKKEKDEWKPYNEFEKEKKKYKPIPKMSKVNFHKPLSTTIEITFL